MLKNREEAGKQLAEKLSQYQDKDAVVLALPRGGVVTGYEIAKKLNLPLDIVVTRKIGHPNNPEYAICAVSENGTLLCNELERAPINKRWLAEEIEKQKEEALRRLTVYRGGKSPIKIRGRAVIIVDDGIATGLSMRLAVALVKSQKPKRTVVAVPVAPREVIEQLENEVDEIVVLLPSSEFVGAVGAHYQEFEQVEDKEVIHLLQSLPQENNL